MKQKKILIGCTIGGTAVIMVGAVIGIGYYVGHKNGNSTEPSSIKTNIDTVITNYDLGEIADKGNDAIWAAILTANTSLPPEVNKNIFGFSDVTNTGATLTVKSDNVDYIGAITVNYSVLVYKTIGELAVDDVVTKVTFTGTETNVGPLTSEAVMWITGSYIGTSQTGYFKNSWNGTSSNHTSRYAGVTIPSDNASFYDSVSGWSGNNSWFGNEGTSITWISDTYTATFTKYFQIIAINNINTMTIDCPWATAHYYLN